MPGVLFSIMTHMLRLLLAFKNNLFKKQNKSIKKKPSEALLKELFVACAYDN